MATDPSLAESWRATWPAALTAWSPYTQLREPLFFEHRKDAAPYGMQQEIAAIRLVDQTVMVNLTEVREKKLEALSLPILAHEIGHHVFVPGNLTDNGRMIAAMKRVLYGLRADAVPMVANLYGDLHINDRLQRTGVDIAGVYRALNAGGAEPSKVWLVYTRAYEILWRLKAGTLSPKGITPEMEGDAALIARIVRHYAGDWLKGARRFAAILYPYLLEDEKANRGQTFVLRGLSDTRDAGAGAAGRGEFPDGLTGIDESEISDDDSFDDEIDDPLGGEGRNLRGRRKSDPHDPENTAPEKEGQGRPGAQYRQPFEYGELLEALGLDLSAHEITTRYYRERALPYLIPFPVKKAPRATEPMPEGYEGWEATDPVESMDVLGTIARSPVVIPGVTTVQRTFAEMPGSDPAKTPMDLDIYVDSSGSMPNPAVDISYLALAGAILALSALRAGARVQATLWSGAGQFDWTDGFIRDERKILGVITGYLGDGTAFPLNVLRETYQKRKKDDPTAHIVVISDDGVDTMLQSDEKAIPGAKLCKEALEQARGGGTLVLNIPQVRGPAMKNLQGVGFRIHAVQQWEELVAFAREFVLENYRDG